MRMAASVVVEGDLPEDVAAGVGLVVPTAVVDVDFTLQRGEERLVQGVVNDEPIRPMERRMPCRWLASAKFLLTY